MKTKYQVIENNNGKNTILSQYDNAITAYQAAKLQREIILAFIELDKKNAEKAKGVKIEVIRRDAK